ncbi:MAG TPA: sulfurtransferase [Rhodanobacteraceae bacterium]|nr:sulfurtransferase [Rhodanobacteraceae bacterium]
MFRTLIKAGELAARAQPTLVVDCRFSLADTEAGARAFAEGHVPGAVYAHLDRDLSGPGEGLGRHPLPQPAAFAATLARWGWRPGLQVVAYDDAGGAMAARLWWLLKLVGHEAVAVLDGGWQAWREAGLPVETTAQVPQPVPLHTLSFDAGRIVYVDELQHLLGQSGTLLLDARAAARFRGESEPVDAVAGHIPGARNRPLGENLDQDGHFKAPERLRQEFDAALQGRAPGSVLHMCGSGVTACHNLLAMEHAGLHGARVFAPSWSGWISDPSRPVERGAAA